MYGVRGDVTNRNGILGLEELTGDHGGVKLLPAYSTLLQRGLGLYFQQFILVKIILLPIVRFTVLKQFKGTL